MPITNALTKVIFLYLTLNFQNPVLHVENAKKRYFGGFRVKQNTIFLITPVIVDYGVRDLQKMSVDYILFFSGFII